MGESSIMLYSGINARMPNVVKSNHLHLIAQIQFVESTLRLLFREFLQLKKIILIPWICRVVSSDQYSLLKFSMFFFQPLLLFQLLRLIFSACISSTAMHALPVS